MNGCPKCGSKVEMMVNITVVMDAKYESAITKKSLQEKGTKLWGASWERASYFCTNESCRWKLLAADPLWVKELENLKEENRKLKEKLNEQV